MNDLMKRTDQIKKYLWFSFIPSFLLFIFAFILLFKEEDIINTFVLLLGYFGLIVGFIFGLRYFRQSSSVKVYSNDLFKAILIFGFGIVAILKNTVLGTMITFLLGGYLIYNHAYRFQICWNLKELFHQSYWMYFSFLSIVGVILGSVIILNPFEGKISINNLIAYCLMISEVMNLFQSIAVLICMNQKPKEVESNSSH